LVPSGLAQRWRVFVVAEMMLRDQAMAASSPFPPGMRCMLRDGPAIRHGVVQKILDDNGRTVFFADKGEM
jgi:hypothetical protein